MRVGSGIMASVPSSGKRKNEVALGKGRRMATYAATKGKATTVMKMCFWKAAKASIPITDPKLLSARIG